MQHALCRFFHCSHMLNLLQVLLLSNIYTVFAHTENLAYMNKLNMNNGIPILRVSNSLNKQGALATIRVKADSYFARARARILMTMEFSKSNWFWFRQQMCAVCAYHNQNCVLKQSLCIIIIAELCIIIRIVYKLCISKNTRDYICRINISRPIDGEFHLLVQDLREMDQELLFFKYFWMNSQQFDQLLLYYWLKAGSYFAAGRRPQAVFRPVLRPAVKYAAVRSTQIAASRPHNFPCVRTRNRIYVHTHAARKWNCLGAACGKVWTGLKSKIDHKLYSSNSNISCWTASNNIKYNNNVANISNRRFSANSSYSTGTGYS